MDETVERTYRDVKDTLGVRLIPEKGHEEALQYMPHQKISDFALIYTAEKPDKSGIEPVTNAMLTDWHVSAKQLGEDAISSAQEKHPAFVRPLKDVLIEMGTPPEQAESGFDVCVASNDAGLYGAAVIAYPDLMEQAAQRFKGDYFVLPSSVHEVLLMPDNGAFKAEELSAMVRDVNITELKPKDILGDRAYHYDSRAHKLERAEDFAARRQKERGSVIGDLKTKKNEVKEKPHQTHPVKGKQVSL